MAHTEEWLEVRPAAEIVSENSGRAVLPNYVRLRAYQGKIQIKRKDGRTNLYLRSDVEKLIVYPRRKKAASEYLDTPYRSML